MARTVEEIMNPELAFARPGERDDAIRDLILSFGITAVPILDAGGRPLGVVSIRDLIDPTKLDQRMTTPAMTVVRTATLDEAATLFCESGQHHLIVIDEAGLAVGMVSAIDVLRGLRGVLTRHPAAFPHRDRKLEVFWSEEGPLESGRLASLPVYPGVIVLVYGQPNVRETPVWAESTANIRLRMEEMLALPEQSPRLAKLLASSKHLRFRVAYVPDAGRRAEIVEKIAAEIDHMPLPSAKALAE
jgi:CBS domain-containing protein